MRVENIYVDASRLSRPCVVAPTLTSNSLVAFTILKVLEISSNSIKSMFFPIS
jgi:hypothetical protein